MDHEKVNILLVDDQPAKLLAYEVILKELGRKSRRRRFRPGSAGISAQERSRRHPGRCLHAGTRRVRACRHDPRASALPEDGDDLHFGDSGQRYRSPARLRDGRRRLCAGAGRSGGVARQDQGLRRTLSQDPATGAAQCRARRPRSRANRRAGGIDAPGWSKASSAAAWRSPPARWGPGTGTGSTATGCGTKANTGSSASIRKAFEVTSGKYSGAAASGRRRRSAQGIGRLRKGRQIV